MLHTLVHLPNLGNFGSLTYHCESCLPGFDNTGFQLLEQANVYRNLLRKLCLTTLNLTLRALLLKVPEDLLITFGFILFLNLEYRSQVQYYSKFLVYSLYLFYFSIEIVASFWLSLLQRSQNSKKSKVIFPFIKAVLQKFLLVFLHFCFAYSPSFSLYAVDKRS